jgi:2-oxoglutarate dehydrogenase complex dehydrogenase (E1) component-like enzyme
LRRLDQAFDETRMYQGAEVVWAQEEPENMGSWRFMERMCRRGLGLELRVVARESASPAAGSLTIHQREHVNFLGRAVSSDWTDGT